MDNIKLFDLYSSYIFDKLYKSFPKCINFSPPEEIHQEQDITTLENKEKIIIFSETILWLEENDFIRIKSKIPNTQRPVEPIPFNAFICVRLSLKGLNLLTSPIPKSLNKRKKLGDEIVEHVKKGFFVEAGKLLTEAMFEFSKEKV